MKKILWLSQHSLSQRQLVAIRKKFGQDVQIDHDPSQAASVNPFESARSIAQRVRARGYDELIFVGPDSVLARLCDEGLNPYVAVVNEVPRDQAEWVTKGRGYKFVGFEKVSRVVKEFIPGEGFSD